MNKQYQNRENMEHCDSYTDYLVNRNGIRKIIRRFYLHSVAKKITVKAIDFGCGIGSLLSMLPEGSIGLEVNRSTVAYCQGKNFNVKLYKPDEDKYEFRDLKKGYYKAFVMNHVLEHIKRADKTFKKILKSCNRLGIEKIVLVVPGKRGFMSDETHETYINYDFLKKNGLFDCEGFQVLEMSYFPFKSRRMGNVFRHNELRVFYGKKS